MSKTQAEGSKGPRQATLMGFFGKPKPGPAPPRPSSSNSKTVPPPLSRASPEPQPTNGVPPTTSSPASTALRTPSSALGSSPAVAVHGRSNGRAGSPVKSSNILGGPSDEELTPPPLAEPLELKKKIKVERKAETEDIEMGMISDGSPVVLSRRAKRKVVYAESDSETSDSGARTTKATSRKTRKTAAQESDDDFVFDNDDDAAMAAVAEEYEASIMSVSPSFQSSPPPKKSKSSFKPPAKASKPKTVPLPRPGPRPLPSANGDDRDSRRSSSHQNSEWFLMTAAEQKKIVDKETKKDNDECFSFLKDVRDKQKRRPSDPDYDKRTIFVPNDAWKTFTPFEKQFWQIKQNHYDTVLFFQKGKFFELYENDATIGHEEFDLKLTERVKMRMVGVPEQQFELWAAKFLAAGYKVGKVEQAETAIGKEMRQQGEGNKAKSKEDTIVRRELAQVFTNGTIVDGTYLTSDDANHCVAIKELFDQDSGLSSYGVCVLDASTGTFQLVHLVDDIIHTHLETLFRQIRPKELLHIKGNLTTTTLRLLRNILPANTLWESFRADDEFCSAEETLKRLQELYTGSGQENLPESITEMIDQPLVMETLGGLLFYTRSMNLEKDLVTQGNFDVYDPIRRGQSLILDGQTLGHMEVLVNNEGGLEGTLLEILSRCQTPFGKRLFRHWLMSPLREAKAINDRLDAVDELLANPEFTAKFRSFAKGLPDLERNISRIHAGSIKQTDFIKVVEAYETIQQKMQELGDMAEAFDLKTINSLLVTLPVIKPNVEKIMKMYSVNRPGGNTVDIIPRPGSDPECNAADKACHETEKALDDLLRRTSKRLGLGSGVARYWHSAQGGKEIFQLEVPADTDVPQNWTKHSGTKAVHRYVTPETAPLIRQLHEARETQTAAKKGYFRRLLAEFDQDRPQWRDAIKVVAELDCLVSLAMASHNLDTPKCRPEFIDSPQAFIDFQDLRHPSMCLRSDFIPNDVQLGGDQARMTLLTGPNMAGKSTLLRMTAAGIIMAQMGCYVPASRARLSSVDRIQTRMGAYDNMFASASTFKVELDETSKILREAGPRSFVILDELGRGTSTYDGMAIAGAVLHQLATHTLPLGFFATHYGSLTDDFSYHPNIRKMHMQTHVDDEQRQVVFLYKLIPGVAESSHGTHVARMAGVPLDVVSRADQVSAEFFAAFKLKLDSRRQSAVPLVAQADFAWLMRLAAGMYEDGKDKSSVGEQVNMIRKVIGTYESHEQGVEA